VRTRGFTRSGGFLRRRHVIAIAYEGAATERIYFEELRPGRDAFIQLVPVPRAGHKSHPKDVLSDLVRWANKNGLRGRGEGWIVIDREDEATRSTQVLDDVCANAARQGFKAAVSNPCFEFWLWLHLRDSRGFTDRHHLKRELKRICPNFEGSSYDATAFVSTANVAIERARTLDQNPHQAWPRNQGTRVYQIVERLLPHRMPAA
jgi:RloB-like protein